MNAAVAGEAVGGRYRLVEPLGQGAAGRVWRALDEVLEREVALKEFPVQPGTAPEQQEVLVGRVMREARAAARLNHPGIITVHDVVPHKGMPALVMEFVRGGSLGALIAREGRLPPERIAAIGFELLDAIGAAHAAGIVHRDLKPDNILLDGRRVVITDFGVAGLADGGALTRAGTVLGTPLYMAPEQIEGLPVTGAADLWSIGATLYTAVEGETPFSAPTLMALFNAILRNPPRPALHAGALGPTLHGLLRKEPHLRPSAVQTAEAFRALLDGRPVRPAVALPPPGPPPPPESPSPPPGRAPGPEDGPVPGLPPGLGLPPEPEPAREAPEPAPGPRTEHGPESRSGQGVPDERDAVLYGTVKWFKSKKGHGLISPDTGSEDVYVHYSQIEMPGFKELAEGRRVSYEVVRGKRGPEARKVRPL